MIKKLIDFCKDEEGASMVEYGLLVVLIALVAAAGITTLGGNLNTMFGNTAGRVGTGAAAS
jgi:pilus assembly protein Flp/PilA